MLEAKAIELLQQSSVSSALNNQLSEQADFRAMVVPDNFKLESLERLQEHRNQFRGKYSTNSIESFTQYTAAKADEYDEDTECFIDAEDISALAYFDIGDIGTPGHCRHSAQVKLDMTSAYRAVLRVNGNAMSQRDTSDWLEDWLPNLKAFDSAGEEIQIKRAIAAVRQITIDAVRKVEAEVGDLSESASLMERIDASSKETMPAVLIFTCEPYNGLEKRRFELRLGVRTGGDRPALILRILRLEAEQEQIANEFRNKLETAFKGVAVKTFIGSFEP
ncbi:MAG: DUF2303 family protein [Idiomarina sp.]|nr:DUF2303 family protein [Idiomarina sp.]